MQLPSLLLYSDDIELHTSCFVRLFAVEVQADEGGGGEEEAPAVC